MIKISGLENWRLDQGVSNAERFLDVRIVLEYPDPIQFVEFQPKKRIKKINEEYQINLKKLTSLNLFKEFIVEGANKRPVSITTKIRYDALQSLNGIELY